MKKLITGFCLMLLSAFTYAQNGLEGIIVEKYYVANAADAAGSVGTLPVGSVTYRIYADMLPGYKFQAAYGVAGHDLILSTTTSFFNNEDRGSTSPTYTKTQARGNTVMLDSWLSAGAGCAANFGILKSEDDVAAGGATVSNLNGILANNDASAGIPLTVQDGLYAGTPEAVTFVGFSAADLAVLDNVSQTGNLFTTTNGSWAALNGATGPIASTNKVLIAQITTDGVFHYELNIQIGTPTGGSQNFVAQNPIGTEISIASLTGTFGAVNASPTVSITSPSNGASFTTGSAVAIAATAADADGTVMSVEFFVDGVSAGVDNTAPYTANYTAAAGSHTLTARATDNGGAQTTSSAITINVSNNPPPAVSITSPVNGAVFVAPAPVTVNVNATDANGTVTLVEFYVNGTLIGSDATAPYSFVWTSVIGAASLTARATDNLGATTTSSAVNITINDPNALPYKIVTTSAPCTSPAICVPLAANDTVHNVIGYDLVMNYNPVKVTPTGNITVDNDLINPAFVEVINSIDATAGTISISLFFNGFAPANATFDGVGNLFCVEFTKTPAFTFNDSAIFSIASIQESYFVGVSQKSADPGKYSSFRDSIFSAELHFWANNSPMPYDVSNPALYLNTNINGNNAACNAPSAVTVHPDLLGVFSHNINNGLNLKISRDIAPATSVQPAVNGFDALLTRKVLLNDLSFIPSIYQAIALDVNMDGVISAGDLSQINQRAVLMIPEFRQAWNYSSSGVSNGQPSKDWLFINNNTPHSDLSYVISSVYPNDDGVGYSKSRIPVVPFCLPVPVINPGTCPEISAGEIYKGILIGDVNGNFGTAGSNGVLRTADSENVIFDLTKAIFNGEYIEVPVSVASASDVNSIDFAVKFNNSKLSFVSARSENSGLQTLSFYNNDDQTLRLTSYSML
jgi:hypothetical protein